MRLKDKVCIVTGGASGLGKTFSLGLAHEGEKVAVCSHATDPAPVVNEIKAKGGQAVGIKVDVRDEESTKQMAAKTSEAFGRIDVLVANAGIYGQLKTHSKRAPEWVGFENYVNLFSDKDFFISLNNTLYMVVIAVPLGLIASFICALLLNLKVRGQAFYRDVYFLPSIVPTVAGTILFLWLLNPQVGLVNTLLAKIGIDGPNWMADPNWSKPALILLGMWGMGGTIVIYLSGLQDVPISLIEAAELDGANWFQRLWHITIPMVSPITLFNLITGMNPKALRQGFGYGDL